MGLNVQTYDVKMEPARYGGEYVTLVDYEELMTERDNLKDDLADMRDQRDELERLLEPYLNG